MNLNLLQRKTHYWLSAFLAVPLLIVIASGIVLQLKKHWSWVQPPEQRGTGTTPRIDLEALLERVRQAPDLTYATWDDVNRIDVRPGRGLAKVSMYSGWEIQVDLGTGRILQTAYRRSDWIESIHDGSFFGGNLTKLGLFLPCGIALLVMWVTGLWMFWLPLWVKRRRKKARQSGC